MHYCTMHFFYILGMPYTCYLKLSYQDGRPVFDDLNPVSVKAGFGPDTNSYETAEYPITSDGIIRLAYVAPEDPSLQVEDKKIKIEIQSKNQFCLNRQIQIVREKVFLSQRDFFYL